MLNKKKIKLRSDETKERHCLAYIIHICLLLIKKKKRKKNRNKTNKQKKPNVLYKLDF